MRATCFLRGDAHAYDNPKYRIVDREKRKRAWLRASRTGTDEKRKRELDAKFRYRRSVKSTVKAMQHYKRWEDCLISEARRTGLSFRLVAMTLGRGQQGVQARWTYMGRCGTRPGLGEMKSFRDETGLVLPALEG